MMCSRIAAVTLSFTIASAPWLDATTLLAIKDGERIVVAADGAYGYRSPGGTKSYDTICKIQAGRRVAIAAAGYTKLTDATGTLVYDFHAVAQRVVGKANDLDEAMEMLRSELADFHAVIPYAFKIHAPDMYESMIGRSVNGVERGTLAVFLLAGVVGPFVTMASVTLDFEIPAGPSRFELMRTWRDVTLCPVRCPQDGVPFVLGMRDAIDAVMPRLRISAGHDLVSQANHLLQEQTATSHGDVGPPFAMVEVTRKGIAWLRQPDVCR